MACGSLFVQIPAHQNRQTRALVAKRQAHDHAQYDPVVPSVDDGRFARG
jgi:hypothetical protein